MTNQIKVNSKVVNFSGLRYVSEKPHYKLEKKAYIDKGPCGVGITTWCCSKANPYLKYLRKVRNSCKLVDFLRS